MGCVKEREGNVVESEQETGAEDRRRDLKKINKIKKTSTPQEYQPPVPTKAPLVYARACW